MTAQARISQDRIAPARRIAFRILLQIAAGEARSDELLRSAAVDRLSPQDRNLVTTLVLGTLRWQIAIDARIRPLLSKPGAKLSSEVETALRLGAWQLLGLDRIPPHAVLHDSVELVKQSRERGAAGLVNALLRRIAGQSRFAASEPLDNPIALAAARSHPAWMVERWALRYGLASAEAICRSNQEPAGITLRLRDPASDPAGLDLAPGAFLASARRLIRGDIARSPGLESGDLRIQDEASQLVAEIAAAALPNPARVLDACAAPGGKTAILAERLPQAGIRAIDVSPKRVAAARKSFPDRVAWQVADAAMLEPSPHYDLILCDVPCSGTGTLARNPEIRLRLSAPDLIRQQQRQAEILRASLAGLNANGRLVYSTCSLEPEENEGVVEQILDAHPGFRLVPVESILDRLTASGRVTAEGRERLRTAADSPFLRTLPGVHPCDGFFAAIFARV
jgi:16S rRNA (cytosine967-C5)-methyltransferase